MKLQLEPVSEETWRDAMEIWNEVVLAGRAFPQTEPLTAEEAPAFFAQQSYTGVARNRTTGAVVGMYTLHPNNIGRCGHLCNASYAVKSDQRGLHVGEALVRDCIERARGCGFRVLQFNAVVKSNTAALALYQKLGFQRLGTIPGGFCNIDGEYEDIILHYLTL